MRLYDTIMSKPGTATDHAYCGCYSIMAPIMKEAQCFDIADNIVDICDHLSETRPSTVLSAMPMLRMPYPKIWLEWTHADHRKGNPSNNGKPIPQKMGCYIESDPDGARGVVVFFWKHKELQDLPAGLDELSIDPIGIVFDWTQEPGKPPREQYADMFLGNTGLPIKIHPQQGFEAHRDAMLKGKKWRKFAQDEKEVRAFMALQARSDVVPLLQFTKLFEVCGPALLPGGHLYESFVNDIAGEFSFIESFILMLNSKNTIIQREREDLSRLNKARAKSRRAPLKEFITTKVRLSPTQQRRHGIASGWHESARQHLCRGHFKLRSTGLFWWSSHLRGFGDKTVRSGYRAE